VFLQHCLWLLVTYSPNIIFLWIIQFFSKFSHGLLFEIEILNKYKRKKLRFCIVLQNIISVVSFPIDKCLLGLHATIYTISHFILKIACQISTKSNVISTFVCISKQVTQNVMWYCSATEARKCLLFLLQTHLYQSKYSLMPKGSWFPSKMMETSQVESRYVPKFTVIISMIPVNEITPQIDETLFFPHSHLRYKIGCNHFLTLGKKNAN